MVDTIPWIIGLLVCVAVFMLLRSFKKHPAADAGNDFDYKPGVKGILIVLPRPIDQERANALVCEIRRAGAPIDSSDIHTITPRHGHIVKEDIHPCE